CRPASMPPVCRFRCSLPGASSARRRSCGPDMPMRAHARGGMPDPHSNFPLPELSTKRSKAMADDYLVEPEWLQERLGDAGIVVLDCTWFVPEMDKSGRDEFRKGHIAGAQYVDLNDISDASSPYVNMLPPAAQFAQ